MTVLNLRSVGIGILATITTDVLSGTALKLGFITSLPPRLTGRWFALMARGQFLHSDIGHVPPINRELAIAVPVHYTTGIKLALVYLLVSSALDLSPRKPIAALGFGLCTNLLLWLLMFPSMGFGWFGTHGPPGTRLFFSSFVTHVFYGFGLWLGVSLPG